MLPCTMYYLSKVREVKVDVMILVPLLPVLMDVAKETRGWLPGVTYGTISSPSYLPLVSASPDPVMQDLFYHIGIRCRNLGSWLVVETWYLSSINVL